MCVTGRAILLGTFVGKLLLWGHVVLVWTLHRSPLRGTSFKGQDLFVTFKGLVTLLCLFYDVQKTERYVCECVSAIASCEDNVLEKHSFVMRDTVL